MPGLTSTTVTQILLEIRGNDGPVRSAIEGWDGTDGIWVLGDDGLNANRRVPAVLWLFRRRFFSLHEVGVRAWQSEPKIEVWI